jgi:hypothetical protein
MPHWPVLFNGMWELVHRSDPCGPRYLVLIGKSVSRPGTVVRRGAIAIRDFYSLRMSLRKAPRQLVADTGFWAYPVQLCFRGTWLFLSYTRDWFLMSRGGCFFFFLPLSLSHSSIFRTFVSIKKKIFTGVGEMIWGFQNMYPTCVMTC